MKKIISKALVLTLVALMAVMPCLAAGITNVTYSDGFLTVDVEGYQDGEQATILVVKSSVEDLDAITEDDIIYIDQVTVDGTSNTYVMPVDDRAAALGATEVKVFAGGTTLETAVEYNDGESIPLEEGGEPGDVITYSARFSTPTAEFLTDEDALAAVVVEKVVNDGDPEVYDGDDIEIIPDTDNKVIEVKVADQTVATLEYTILVPGDKTAIAGTIKYQLLGNYNNVAAGALVLVTNGATIVGSAVADADGAFEIEVPEGNYRVVVRFARLTTSNVTNYANTVFTDVSVTEGFVNTLTSDGVDFIKSSTRLLGDANDDGVVNSLDYTAVVNGLSAN